MKFMSTLPSSGAMQHVTPRHLISPVVSRLTLAFLSKRHTWIQCVIYKSIGTI